MSDNPSDEFFDLNDLFDWDTGLALGVESRFQSSYNRLSLSESADEWNSLVAEYKKLFLPPGEAQSSSEVNGSSNNSVLNDWSIFDDLDLSGQFPPALFSSNPTDANELLPLPDELQGIHALQDTDELRSDSSEEQAIDQIKKQLQSETVLLPEYQTDEMHLQEIKKSIRDHHCSMTIRTQPPNNRRFRYKSDGKRQLERSRSEPMAINLPDLKDCHLNPNQLYIELMPITTNNNPQKKQFRHEHKLEYHADGAQESDKGLVRVPLSKEDIESGVKKFPRLSIIGTKRDDYTFDLIPFDSPLTDGPVEKYTTANEKKKTQAAKAKEFLKDYDLSSCQILCQLMIKQNETWHQTGISCQTETITEKKQVTKSTSSIKRSKRETDDELESDESGDAPMPSPTKRQKRSSSLMNGLPVTYFSTNGDTGSDVSIEKE